MGRYRSSISRRDFLRAAGAAAGAVALGGCGDLLEPNGGPGGLQPGIPKRVAILGGGLSGLVAGFELDRLGHDVTILEARDRVGGRSLTLRSPFMDGQFAEAGAARIPPGHDLTLGYAELFDLPLGRFYPDAGSFVQHSAGVRTEVAPATFLASRPDYVKLLDGTEALGLAFAAALGSRVRLSSPVSEVDQRGTGVVVSGESGWTVEADRVLCTVPLPVLDRIRFLPDLSSAKREAAAGGFQYMPSTRIFVQFTERFWEAEGLNGWATTDWPEELWHPTWDVGGPRGVLLSYVRGDRALAIDALDGPGRVQAVLDHWEGIFPGVTEHAEAAAVYSWQDDPWSGRAWAAPTGSQLAQYGSSIRQPEGRIHFAGEHTSDDRGWMQGALASGLRTVQEINAA